MVILFLCVWGDTWNSDEDKKHFHSMAAVKFSQAKLQTKNNSFRYVNTVCYHSYIYILIFTLNWILTHLSGHYTRLQLPIQRIFSY